MCNNGVGYFIFKDHTSRCVCLSRWFCRAAATRVLVSFGNHVTSVPYRSASPARRRSYLRASCEQIVVELKTVVHAHPRDRREPHRARWPQMATHAKRCARFCRLRRRHRKLLNISTRRLSPMSLSTNEQSKWMQNATFRQPYPWTTCPQTQSLAPSCWKAARRPAPFLPRGIRPQA